jgi:hypothetical protein
MQRLEQPLKVYWSPTPCTVVYRQGGYGLDGMYNALINGRITQSLPYRDRIIDLSYGKSLHKEGILKAADQYMSVDRENSFHDQHHVNFFADFSELFPLNNDYADTMVSFQITEHLTGPSFLSSEYYRTLRPCEGLCITVPFMWRVRRPPYDYLRFTRHDSQYLLQKNRIIKIKFIENASF